MATNWAERLAHLHALYDQGYEQGGKFQECIEQCERTLESGMSPFWRIKTFCILVAACQYDWNEAEEWRQAGEDLYWSLPQNEDTQTLKVLRSDLDDLYAYQAEDPERPSWFQTKEMYERRICESRSRDRENMSTSTSNRTPIGEDFDMEEESDMEEDPIPQSDDAGDDETAASGDVGDTDEDEDEDDEMEVDEDGEAVEAVEAVEAIESVQDVAAVQGIDIQAPSVGSVLDGNATKKPSLVSRTRETGIQIIRRMQSTMGLKGKDNEVKKTGSSSLTKDDKKDGLGGMWRLCS